MAKAKNRVIAGDYLNQIVNGSFGNVFIIGVSDYNLPRINNMPFCKNDINLIRHAFIEELKVDPSNIIECGSNGVVSK